MEVLLFEDKIRHSLEKVRQTPDVQDLKYYGEVCFRYGRLAEALKSFQKITRIQPQNTSAYLHIAAIFFHLKDYKESYKSLDRINKIHPFSFEGYVLYNMLKEIVADGFKSLPLFENFKTTGNEVSSLEIKIQLEKSAQDEQIHAYRDWLEKNPDPRGKYFLNMAEVRKSFYMELENKFNEVKDIVKVEGEPVLKYVCEKEDIHKKIKEVLEDMVGVKSVTSAAVMTQGGKILQSVFKTGVAQQEVYFEIIPALNFIDKWIRENNTSPLNLWMLNFEETLIFFQKVLKEFWICVTASGGVNFGAVKYNIEKNKARIEEILK